jgi:hypothetical protein
MQIILTAQTTVFSLKYRSLLLLNLIINDVDAENIRTETRLVVGVTITTAYHTSHVCLLISGKRPIWI